jgi:hypothetical protein
VNPDFLPALQRSLRALGEHAARHDVSDRSLAEIAAEIDRARALVAQARGAQRANGCARHPGGPVDPTAPNGCLLCGVGERRPARPLPPDFTPGEVLRFIQAHGQDAAARQYGGQAVTRALAAGHRHPSTPRPGHPAAPSDHTQGAM